MEQLPRKGVYALVVRVPQTTTIVIGRLGRIDFHAGFYVYIGSALNSLPGRISRHMKKSKKNHWHIDYLLGGLDVRVIRVGWKGSARRVECLIARRVGEGSGASMEGFGCGDCGCDSHLHYFPRLEQAVASLSEAGLHIAEVSPQRARGVNR